MDITKTLLLSCCAVGLTVSVGCNGEKPSDSSSTSSAAPAAETKDGSSAAASASDAFALYKTKGRTWMHKSDSSGFVSYIKYEVESVADDHAMLKTTMCKDADGTPMDGMPAQPATKIAFAAPATGDAAAAAPAVDLKEETVTVAAGEFDCILTEAGGSKTWSSKDFPGLVVKMEGNGMSMELVKFDK